MTMAHSKTSASPLHSKKRRTGRSVSRGAQVRLQTRDLWCLEAVAKLRFMTTDQICRVYFPDTPHYAAKRLRRLVDAGLLRVFLRSLADSNIYTITRPGLTRLKQSGIDLTEEVKVPQALDGNLDHLLCINTLRCAFALGLGNLGATLTWWRSDWEMARNVKKSVVPDALFSLHWDWGQEAVYALELENASRSPRSFAKKIVSYQTLLQQTGAIFGYDKLILLVVVNRESQLTGYRARTNILGETPWIWFARADTLTAETLGEQLWQSAADDDYLSLRDLSYLSLQ
jgi:hypothetical protein